MVTVPKPPGSSASISPPTAVLEYAPGIVLQGAVRLHGFASSPTPETHVRVACAWAADVIVQKHNAMPKNTKKRLLRTISPPKTIRHPTSTWPTRTGWRASPPCSATLSGCARPGPNVITNPRGRAAAEPEGMLGGTLLLVPAPRHSNRPVERSPKREDVLRTRRELDVVHQRVEEELYADERGQHDEHHGARAAWQPRDGRFDPLGDAEPSRRGHQQRTEDQVQRSEVDVENEIPQQDPPQEQREQPGRKFQHDLADRKRALLVTVDRGHLQLGDVRVLQTERAQHADLEEVRICELLDFDLGEREPVERDVSVRRV